MTKDITNRVSGSALLGLGIFVVIYAQKYEFGSLTQIGPGFFPTVLGSILCVLSLMIIIGKNKQVSNSGVNWKQLFLITSSMIIFAAVLSRLGLLIATTGLIFLSSLAGPKTSLLNKLYLVFALNLLAWVIFVLVLKMNIPIFPVGG